KNMTEGIKSLAVEKPPSGVCAYRHIHLNGLHCDILSSYVELNERALTDDILNYANKSLICSNFCRLIIVQEYYKTFVFASIQHLYVNDVLFRLENSSNGVKNLDLSALLNDEEMIIPSNEIAKDFSKSYLPFLKNIYLFGQEIELIKELQSLLLAKMGQ
ncbi:MAG: hypothetical protein VZR53_13590, partial [Prevotella sp.]|nr:hypothetical protein [Prevotella sp.]